MGSLGSYLSAAREARGMDLHEAAQETRISVHYLRAMEHEDFSKLPGEVFVRGFLKSYGKFLNLDEAEVMRRYQELQPQKQSSPPERRAEPAQMPQPSSTGREFPLEPVVWGGALVVALIALLFMSLPQRNGQTVPPQSAEQHALEEKANIQEAAAPERQKLYLEIVALEDVWLLVRTDASPQKKAVLRKGESIIWSADERFLLSYGSVGSVKLLLNGNELVVKAPRNAIVRDIMITASGITTQKVQTDQKRPPRPRPQAVQEAPVAPAVQPTAPPQPPPAQLPAPQPASPPAPETQPRPEPASPVVSPSE